MRSTAALLVASLAASASALQLPTAAQGVSARTLPRGPIRTPAACMQVGGNAKEAIEKMVSDNKVRHPLRPPPPSPARADALHSTCVQVFLFMKGNKMFPQCGFSNTAVMILKSIPAAADFETFDVLGDQSIREGIKTYSNWPTIPQCYIDGEFIGGCDLMIEMYQNGELQEEIEKAVAS